MITKTIYLEGLQHVVAYRWILDEFAEEIDVTQLGQQNVLLLVIFRHLYKRTGERYMNGKATSCIVTERR
jgi:hypothetical protein